VVPLFVADLLEAFVSHLVRGIVDERVDVAEIRSGSLDDRTTMSRVRKVSPNQHAFAAGVLDVARDFLGVFIFVEVRDQNVGAFPGKSNRDRAADAAVAAGDDRALAGQFPRTPIAVLPTIGNGIHPRLDAWYGLLLGGKPHGLFLPSRISKRRRYFEIRSYGRLSNNRVSRVPTIAPPSRD
jgi:hypothetical protein